MIYDLSGRELAKGASGAWTCTTYDARDRVISQRIPSSTWAPERVVTNNYAVNGDPLVTSVTDSFGTVTTQVDLLNRVVAYTDVHGVRTETGYDPAGRVSATKVIPPNPIDPPQITTNSYDDAGRILTTKVDNVVLATSVYDNTGELASVTYSTAPHWQASARTPRAG